MAAGEDNMDGIWPIPVAFFGFIAAAIIVPSWLQHRGRALALRAIGEAAAKGQAIDAALVERLMPPRRMAVGKWFAIICLVFGAPALGVGAGLIVAALATGQATFTGGMVNVSFGGAQVALGLIAWRTLTGAKAPRWDFATVMALVCLFIGASGLSLCVALMFAAQIQPPDVQDGMGIGALVNGGAGAALLGLGVFLMRVFGERYKET
jgi:hypothetical protein